jgi:hypothetical protein
MFPSALTPLASHPAYPTDEWPCHTKCEILQKNVPSAVFAIRGARAAVDVSLELNISLVTNGGT